MASPLLPNSGKGTLAAVAFVLLICFAMLGWVLFR